MLTKDIIKHLKHYGDILGVSTAGKVVREAAVRLEVLEEQVKYYSTELRKKGGKPSEK